MSSCIRPPRFWSTLDGEAHEFHPPRNTSDPCVTPARRASEWFAGDNHAETTTRSRIVLASGCIPIASYCTTTETTALVTNPGFELDTRVRNETVMPAVKGPTIIVLPVIGVECPKSGSPGSWYCSSLTVAR